MKYFSEQINDDGKFYLGIRQTFKNKMSLTIVKLDKPEIEEFISDLEFIQMSGVLPVFKEKDK